MSIEKKERIECPYCNHEQVFESYESINLTKNPELKEKIINEELFKMKCEKCGKEALIAFPCLFHDMDKKQLIWLIGDYTPEQKQALDKDLMDSANGDEEKLFAESYNRRIVSSINELKEKIILMEDDLDDRVIEVLKILCVNEVIGQLMGVTISEVRYNRTESGKKYLILIFVEKEPSMIEINNDMYRIVKKKFMDDINANTPREGFAEINAYWAKDVIENSDVGLIGESDNLN